MTSRPILKNLIFSVILISCFFALLELVARRFGRGERPVREDYLRYTLDPDLLWHFVPGQHVVQASKGIEYQINSEGLRGRDFPLRKPEDEKRILVIGDSVSFGFGVDEGESYPSILEKQLRELMPGTDISLINSGVNGYSTREELMFLRKKGIGYEPDIALIGFVLNDASIYARQYQLKSFIELRNAREREEKLGFVHRLSGRLRFIGIISNAIDRLRPGGLTLDELRTRRCRLNRDIMYLESDEALAGWSTSMGELDEMLGVLADHDIESAVVVFPSRFQFEEKPTPDKPQRMLREFCESRSVPFLDLLPFILESGGERQYLDETHFSAEGCETIAETIRDFLIESKLLDRI